MPSLLILSAHFDDGILSLGAAGARFAADGDTVTIATIFGGAAGSDPSPLALRLHGVGALAVPEMRRREDALAAAEIGARAIHLDFPEAIYRRRSSGHPMFHSMREILGGDTGREQGLLSQLVIAIGAVCASTRALVVCAPAGIGGHVDHLLVRDASLLLGSMHTWVSALWLYEDLPYAIAGAPFPDPPSPWKFREATLLSDPEAWMSKRAAIMKYGSQSELLRSMGYDEVGAHRHAWKIGRTGPAERIWIAQASLAPVLPVGGSLDDRSELPGDGIAQELS